MTAQIAQRDLQLLESHAVIDALRSSVDMLDAARAADAASSAVAHETIVRRAQVDVATGAARSFRSPSPRRSRSSPGPTMIS